MAKTLEEQVADLTRQVSNLVSNLGKTDLGKQLKLDTANAQSAFDRVSSVVEKFRGGFEALKKEAEETQGMFQNLSKSGMNFSGNLFELNNAAIGMRMSTKEMEESFSQFSKEGILVGFGSDLTRSAENFAKASKSFFDNNSQAADSLRRMGFTTKDINEVLVLQGATLRGSFKNEQEKNEIMAANAEKLAIEMDSLAKLTGKSRQEQVEQMKKVQADQQFEAALKLKAREIEDPVKRAEFIANAQKELKQAELEGRGQMFKEMFATGGSLLTKEAATQAVLLKDSADATRKSVMASLDTTISTAEREKRVAAANEDLRVAQIKEANDTQILRIRSYGNLTAIGDMLNKTSAPIQVTTRNLEEAANKYNQTAEAGKKINLETEEGKRKAAQLAMAEIEKSQKGMTSTGEQVDGANRALSQLQGRAGDVASALNEKLVQPLQGEVNKALGSFADSVLNAKGNLGGMLPERKGSDNRTVAQVANKELETGFEKGFKGSTGYIQSTAGIARDIRDGIANTVNSKEWRDSMLNQIKGIIPGKSTGSLGTTGSLFENFGSGTPVMLHGVESVMRPEDLEKIVSSANAGLMKSIPSTGVIDYASLGKNIDATVSAAAKGQERLANEMLLTGQSVSKEAATQASNMKNAAEVMRSGQVSQSDKKDSKSAEAKDAKPVSASLPKGLFSIFDPTNTGGLKNKQSEIAANDEVKKKEQEKKAATNVEEMKKGIAENAPSSKPEEKKPEAAKSTVTAGKEATLSDVVASLNQLNTKVTQLIDVQKDMGNKQIRATKANSKDVYAS